jgi:hypothetical protein
MMEQNGFLNFLYIKNGFVERALLPEYLDPAYESRAQIRDLLPVRNCHLES